MSSVSLKTILLAFLPFHCPDILDSSLHFPFCMHIKFADMNSSSCTFGSFSLHTITTSFSVCGKKSDQHGTDCWVLNVSKCEFSRADKMT